MPPETQPAATCAVCRQLLPTAAMAQFGKHWVCVGCKAVAVQRLREGVPLTGDPAAAGQEPGGVLASLSDPELGVVAFRLGQPIVFPDYCPVTGERATTDCELIHAKSNLVLTVPATPDGATRLQRDRRLDWLISGGTGSFFMLWVGYLGFASIAESLYKQGVIGIGPFISLPFMFLPLVAVAFWMAWRPRLRRCCVRVLKEEHDLSPFRLQRLLPRTGEYRWTRGVVVLQFRNRQYVRDLLRLNAPGAEPRPAPAAPADR